MHTKRSLTVFTLSHFCVDFACFYFLFGVFSVHSQSLMQTAEGFLLYNILAFGTQPLIGYYCDLNGRFRPALTGCALLIAGILMFRVPWIALLLCGLGNAFFHVGGGTNSLVFAGGKMARSGIFVSSGALGVAAGTFAGINELDSPLLLTGIITLCFTAILHYCDPAYRHPPFAPVQQKVMLSSWTAILPVCLLSIAIRAFVGTALPAAGGSGIVIFFLPALCAFGGKLSGGFLADRLGAGRVGAGSLLLSIPLFLLGAGHPLISGLGLLFFNMTMSITLWAIAAQLPGFPGLAFGLNTLGLLCGSLPSFYIELPQTAALPVIGGLILLSAVAVLIAVPRGTPIHTKTIPQADREPTA